MSAMPKFVQGGIMNQNILTPCQRRRGLFLNKFDSLGKVGTFFHFSSQNDMPLKYLSSDSFVKSIFLMNYRERFICDASKHVPFECDSSSSTASIYCLCYRVPALRPKRLPQPHRRTRRTFTNPRRLPPRPPRPLAWVRSNSKPPRPRGRTKPAMSFSSNNNRPTCNGN